MENMAIIICSYRGVNKYIDRTLHGVRKGIPIKDTRTRNDGANASTKTIEIRRKYRGKLASLEENVRAIHDRHRER